MSKMPIERKAMQGGLQSVRQSKISMLRVWQELYAKAQSERVSYWSSIESDQIVFGRQQFQKHRTALEGKSSKCGELGQRIFWTITQCRGSWEAQDSRTRRAFHFYRQQKNIFYVLTVVDRETRCILSWDVVKERTSDAVQACLDRAPRARQYYSDAFPVYDTLYYGAPYELRNDKKETYSVEGVNAELRHYLKRLARRSRCFSRCLYALKCAIRLLVFCYNQWQLWKRLYPAYPANLIDFLNSQV